MWRQGVPLPHTMPQERILERTYDLPETVLVPAGRVEQGVESSGEVASLSTHRAPSPCTGEVSIAETHYQRVDQACPDDNVALNVKGLDKNNMLDTATLAGR